MTILPYIAMRLVDLIDGPSDYQMALLEVMEGLVAGLEAVLAEAR